MSLLQKNEVTGLSSVCWCRRSVHRALHLLRHGRLSDV